MPCVRPGSNVTRPPDVRDGGFALNSGSMRTAPVKFSAGPWRDGCELLRVTVIDCEDSLAEATRQSEMTVAASRLMSSLRTLVFVMSALQSSFPGVTGSSRMRLPVA
jgi:hypothetical protein